MTWRTKKHEKSEVPRNELKFFSAFLLEAFIDPQTVVYWKAKQDIATKRLRNYIEFWAVYVETQRLSWKNIAMSLQRHVIQGLLLKRTVLFHRRWTKFYPFEYFQGHSALGVKGKDVRAEPRQRNLNE